MKTKYRTVNSLEGGGEGSAGTAAGAEI